MDMFDGAIFDSAIFDTGETAVATIAPGYWPSYRMPRRQLAEKVQKVLRGDAPPPAPVSESPSTADLLRIAQLEREAFAERHAAATAKAEAEWLAGVAQELQAAERERLAQERQAAYEVALRIESEQIVAEYIAAMRRREDELALVLVLIEA